MESLSRVQLYWRTSKCLPIALAANAIILEKRDWTLGMTVNNVDEEVLKLEGSGTCTLIFSLLIYDSQVTPQCGSQMLYHLSALKVIGCNLLESWLMASILNMMIKHFRKVCFLIPSVHVPLCCRCLPHGDGDVTVLCILAHIGCLNFQDLCTILY
jgi:hypothetical protein